MSTIDKINAKNTKTEFDKKVLTEIQHLHPYVKHRLYIAESKGILPKNMYSSNGIIDEGIALLYEQGYNIDIDSDHIKLKLFKFVDDILDNLLKKESFHTKTVSTNSLLEEELDKLNEDYTIDADLDLVLKTELNDISYHQDKDKNLFVYEDGSSAIANVFDLKKLPEVKYKNVLGSLYSWLPITVADIMDLFVFGKLSFEEIAEIKNIETKRVERIFNAIKKSLRSHIE